MKVTRPARIVLADDDAGDVRLARRALERARVANDLTVVCDGQALLDHLRGPGPLPDLILLDLNMPIMGGIEALDLIRHDAELAHIPVVVLTSSNADADVLSTYSLGANSFINKPVDFAAMVELIQGLDHYWFQIVTLAGD